MSEPEAPTATWTAREQAMADRDARPARLSARSDRFVREHVFVRERVVSIADVGTRGVVRLEAIGRYLQDVAHEHLETAGLIGVGGWVLRKLELIVDTLATFDEHLTVSTSCTATGRRACERRTVAVGDRGGAFTATAIWVCVDPATGASTGLPGSFHTLLDVPSGRRELSTRLRLRRPAATVTSQPWPTRVADFDLYGHMNNAACCAPIDEVVSARELDHRLHHVEIEYRRPIGPGAAPHVAHQADAEGLDLWLLVDDDVHVAARVAFRS